MKRYSFCITFTPTVYATIDTTIIHQVYKPDFAACVPFCTGRKFVPVCHGIAGRVRSSFLSGQGASPWSSGRVLDHRSLPPVFESRCRHIWRLFRLWLRLITFGGRSAHLAYFVHKSGRKTSIIIFQVKGICDILRDYLPMIFIVCVGPGNYVAASIIGKLIQKQEEVHIRSYNQFWTRSLL